MWRTAVIALAACVPSLTVAAELGGCGYNTQTHQFRGNSAEQLSCLLKKVRAKGSGADTQKVPLWLLANVTKVVDITEGSFERYLKRESINLNADLGGPIDRNRSYQVRYFVIHDTSWPEIDTGSTFPSDIDEPDYKGNRFTSYSSSTRKRVNLLIARDGRSTTFNTWGALRTLPAVKLEEKRRSIGSRNRMVHVENVQPRIKPKKSFAWIAPVPGFSAKQEERLALAYISASVAAGRWLIPAYHFNVDQDFPDGHDDPQNADLGSWVSRIERTVANIKRG